MICLCGREFHPVKNAKTCSPKCSAIRKSRRERHYRTTHAEFIRIIHRHSRQARRTFDGRIKRAVRLLFKLTGEHHV